jgi:alpha-mannosidase
VRHLRRIGCLVPAALRDALPPGEPAEAGAALLNRGTVSYCAYPDGTLTMSLMRSCTGWPSGLWIDPPTRAVPDGSGFQLEHWGHAFRYALVSHDGHWQDSGLWRAGHEYNSPPVARWGRPTVPKGADILSCGPEGVVCLSVRPAGAAVGLPLDEPPAGPLAVRLQECAGRPVEARLRPAFSVAAAW